MWYPYKSRDTDQWNRTMVPEIDPHRLSIDSPERCQGNSVGERIVFSTNDDRATRYPSGEMNFNPSSHHIQKWTQMDHKHKNKN